MPRGRGVFKVRRTKTFDISAALMERKTKTFVISAAIEEVKTGSFVISAVLAKRVTKTFTTDLALVEKNKTSTFVISAVVSTLTAIGMRTDFETILDELTGRHLTLRKATETTDSAGALTASSETDVAITGILQPLTQKDRELMEAGIAQVGDMKGFFKHAYTLSGVNYSVENGDVIIDWNDVKWRVITITGKRSWNELEAFRVVILRRLN